MYPSTKLCKRCDEVKPHTAFAKDRQTKTGLAYYCKDCRSDLRLRHRQKDIEAAREYDRERQRTWQSANADRVREYRRKTGIKSRYGISLERYQAIIARGCSICGTHEGQICLDHDHSSGEIRDALCGYCNRGLGTFKDDPDLLNRARNYLIAHGKVRSHDRIDGVEG